MLERILLLLLLAWHMSAKFLCYWRCSSIAGWLVTLLNYIHLYSPYNTAAHRPKQAKQQRTRIRHDKREWRFSSMTGWSESHRVRWGSGWLTCAPFSIFALKFRNISVVRHSSTCVEMWLGDVSQTLVGARERLKFYEHFGCVRLSTKIDYTCTLC